MRFGFKEWAVICRALAIGRQALILRKGGIAEGRAGFAFQHEEFFLFPTWFHEQLERTTLPLVGRSRFSRHFIVVVLPAPFRPNSP